MYRERQPRERWTALRVSGHADQRGPESYNMELSKKRAESVREYLVSRGVPEDIIDVRAYGEERPIVPDPDSPADLQKNRRVQFEIVRGPRGEKE
jgi:outer membrane protein OmpA-like peptidoglycan-associated protein